MELFVDGSRYYHEGSPKTGFAVTTVDEIKIQEAFPHSQSAQEAELRALTEDCILAENQTANIHTDLRYAATKKGSYPESKCAYKGSDQRKYGECIC